MRVKVINIYIHDEGPTITDVIGEWLGENTNIEVLKTETVSCQNKVLLFIYYNEMPVFKSIVFDNKNDYNAWFNNQPPNIVVIDTKMVIAAATSRSEHRVSDIREERYKIDYKEYPTAVSLLTNEL